MNKFKKIGLSALAGSLVAVSAANADVSVSGGASIGVSQTNETAAAGYYTNDTLSFSYSGETDSGLTVTQSIAIDGGVQDDMSTSVAGSFGTLTFHKTDGSSVMGGWDDMTPTAYQEVWDVAELALADGVGEDDVSVIGGVSGSNLWRYDSPSFNGVTVHAAYQHAEQAATRHNGATVSSYNDFGVMISPEAVEGLTIGYAFGEVEETATKSNDESTLFATYAYGPVTVGYQVSDVDGQTATEDDESVAYSIVYAVNDDFSVSYGSHTLDLGSETLDQESTGFSASYTMGGMSISLAMNEIENVGGNAGASNDIKGYDLAVGFAF